MKIYLAARFSRRHEVHTLGQDLQALGHTIVSRWSRPDDDHVLPTGLSEQASDDARRRFALEDMEDLHKANCLILLGEPPRNNSRGGHLVEFGVALGLGLRVMVVGPRGTVFHCLPTVEVFDTWQSLLKEVQT